MLLAKRRRQKQDIDSEFIQFLVTKENNSLKLRERELALAERRLALDEERMKQNQLQIELLQEQLKASKH